MGRVGLARWSAGAAAALFLEEEQPIGGRVPFPESPEAAVRHGDHSARQRK